MNAALAKVLAWGVPAVALLMVALTLTPAGVWKAPVNDAVYQGFDPNLIYADDGGGGSVRLSRASIDIEAPAGTEPSTILATSLLSRMTASLSVTVVNSASKEALRIGYWSPWTNTGYFVLFGPSPANLIESGTMSTVGAGPRPLDGPVVNRTSLGHYRVGSAYKVRLVLDKVAGTITTTITGPDGTTGSGSLRSQQSPEIFSNVQVSLVTAVVAGESTSHVVLSDYGLTLPHQRLWASKVEDPVERAVLVALALAGLLLVAIRIFIAVRGHSSSERPPTAGWRGLISAKAWLLALVAAAVVVYLAGNALLFRLGGHPFDMGAEKLYAYVARAYGPAQLYYLPNTVSLARIFNGVPSVETAFPYDTVTAYLSSSIGWLGSLLFAGGGIFTVNDVRLEYLIKAVNVLFGLADAALIFVILRRIGVSERWSLGAAAMFLFNPAVWFSMSIWGQTHVFSLFLVLAAILFAELRMPFWAWLALGAACLTRPQILVFGLLLGIVFLRKFPLKQNLTALSWAAIVTFLLLIPFTIATSPSLPVDVMLNNFHVQEGAGNTTALNTVSQTAYSIWPLVTYFQQGVSGLDRFFVPSSTKLIGSLTYQSVSQVLTLVAMLSVAALLFRKRRALDGGGYLPLVALGIMLFLMLLTGIVATHFLLALPLLLLCRRWMGNVAYFAIALVWTISTLVPMFGSMGQLVSPQDYPLFAPAHNAITKFFVDLYANDRFITSAIIANVYAVGWLAVLAFRRTTPQPPPQPAVVSVE